MNIILGTAQFGLAYGINNSSGKTSDEEVKKTLDFCFDEHIHTLDSSECYGNSIDAISNYKHHSFNIIFKFVNPLMGPYTSKTIELILNKLSNTRKNISCHNISTLMFHKLSDLQESGAENLISAIRNEFPGTKIGVSVYHQPELPKFIDKYQLDTIQIPLNIIDQTHVKNGFVDWCKKQGVEVHVRSIFLQGLLTMKNRPSYFSKWRDVFDTFDMTCLENNFEAIDLCLKYILEQNSIGNIVVGTNDANQLADIIKRIKVQQSSVDTINSFDEFYSKDIELIEPVNWRY